jgi:hypothetical protein
MASAPLAKRPHEPLLRLGPRDLARLRSWMSAAAEGRLASPGGQLAAGPAAPERRLVLRRQFETSAILRPISAGGPGGVQNASVVDVSREGIALRVSQPLVRGQAISLEINPPNHLSPTTGAEAPVRILAVVRYCRGEAGSYVLGCSFGAAWQASLASEMFPPDLVALRKSA